MYKFLHKFVSATGTNYTIDPNRIFVFGTSSGGFMAHHLGARLPGRFAAIAPWAGLLALNDFVAGPPVSVIHFHGAQDKSVLYNGLPNWGFSGVEHGIRLWATRNRCKSTPTVITDDPNTLTLLWAGSKGTGDVVLYKLKNQGHKFPTQSDFNLPEIAWTFFKNHPRSNVKTKWPESQSPAEFFAVGPYLGQIPPGSTAQVFAPGLICDTRPYQWESWPSFSADGNTFCFNRLRYAYITENTDQGWTTPERIESIPYHAWSGGLSPDANSIYIRCGPFSKAKRRRRRGVKMCMRRCLRTDQGWSLPLELGPPFDATSGDFTVAADNSICFQSKIGGFWLAPFVGNTWTQASKIPIEMGNLRGHSPGVAPDKSFLVFYSVKPGAPLGTETNLYLTLRRPDGSWIKPQNMGPKINSGHFEFGARISPDKKYMFFTRSTGWNLRPVCDTGDIYWVELKEYLPESYR